MIMLECHSSHADFVKLGVMIHSNIYHICLSVASLLAVAVVATLLILSALWVSWWIVGQHCSYSMATSGLYGHIQSTQNP